MFKHVFVGDNGEQRVFVFISGDNGETRVIVYIKPRVFVYLSGAAHLHEVFL